MLENSVFASSRGLRLNTGNGPTLQPIDIGHPDYVGLVDPDTAFWALVKKDKLPDALTDGSFLQQYREKQETCSAEMKALRFGLKPSAVYFNPTERCNLNCNYCYIPEALRKDGVHMSKSKLIEALGILKEYFKETLPGGSQPQIIFHGSEPMLNREAVFDAIDTYKDDFTFGVQTNGTLLNDEALEFLTSRGIGIGLSLDGHIAQVADRTRKTWAGSGVSRKVMNTLERLKGYPNYNVICTVTRENMETLTEIVDFFHALEIPACMLNPVRCTRPGARAIRPQDHELSHYYLKALDRTYELYQKTGRKLVVANFSNILVSIVAPTARRLMCDISPCGGGRCFFAVSAKGDLFPCSEFIGLEAFNGGNLFKGEIKKALDSRAFGQVTGRKAENIEPCSRCAVRHFCGSPCPAEAYEMNGGMNRPGAFCELYEEQARYALRLIADGKEDAYLWDNWDSETSTTIDITAL
ncbi:MAG: peptide-modifying radical SAM enzyme CbpB [Chloroflexi bacterium]|nr:peptide-modifying radical SAM enzyme CbpB [Chloroflexota bacterium]MCL5274573.1 peptide-modifying radical SAM enzyme CbpB [Chloroflexota bacterium]